MPVLNTNLDLHQKGKHSSNGHAADKVVGDQNALAVKFIGINRELMSVRHQHISSDAILPASSLNTNGAARLCENTW